MAIQVLNNAVVWWQQFDFSGDHNQVSLAEAEDDLDSGVFGDVAHRTHLGAGRITASGTVLYQAGSGLVDTNLAPELAAIDRVISISPDGGDDGERAYSFLAAIARHSPFEGAAYGGLLVSIWGAAGRGTVLVPGTILHPKTVRTATGNGTGRNLGAVSAAQSVYGALHVFTVSGSSPTLDVIVQSDSDNTWASPISRLTFAQKTAVGAEWKSAAGAITDGWWRVNYTIAGTTPSFTFAVVTGIR